MVPYFLAYTAIALITYSFFACIVLFDLDLNLKHSIIYGLLTVVNAALWPIFYLYLVVCYACKLPSTYLQLFN